MARLIYYYQTPSTLDGVADGYVYVSALHFTEDGGIHLNDQPADQQPGLWADVEAAAARGVTTMVMLGGAGGAFTELFRHFERNFGLLVDLLRARPYIRGIDLDVEEECALQDVRMLINRLDQEFGAGFLITMAPVQAALESDQPGMGGFSYGDLRDTLEGRRVDWFNAQCYGDYTSDAYARIVANGYAADRVVFGVDGDAYPDDAAEQVRAAAERYDDFGGVFLWEYGDTGVPPLRWGEDMRNAMRQRWWWWW